MTTRTYVPALPKLSRDQAAALSRLAARARRIAPAPFTRSLSALLGAAVTARHGPPSIAPARALGVQARLRHALGDAELTLGLPSLDAAIIVEHALGGDGTLAVAEPLGALDERSVGALAYVIARVLADARSAFRLSEITQPTAVAPPDAGALALPLELDLPALRLHAELRLPPSVVLALPPMPAVTPTLHADVPITLCAVAGASTLPLPVVRSLALGDVVVLDSTQLAREASGFGGPCELRVPGSRLRYPCTARGDELRLDGHAQGTEEDRVTTGKLIDADETLLALAADAPIELTVELARFSVTLAELSQLGPGSVLQTGRRVGEPVTLCAAGRAVADAELVDVDGELGARITRLRGA